MTTELLGALIGTLLSIAILSYVIGDNLFYRLAISIFIGAAAAFAVIVAAQSVIVPWLTATLFVQPADPTLSVIGALPLVLAFLLVLRSTRRFGGIGGIGLSIVIGVGVAIALLGALNGTLLPLMLNAANGSNTFERILTTVITTVVLLSFAYGRRRKAPLDAQGSPRARLPMRVIRATGQGLLTVALGAGYALLILSTLTALTNVIATQIVSWTR